MKLRNILFNINPDDIFVGNIIKVTDNPSNNYRDIKADLVQENCKLLRVWSGVPNLDTMDRGNVCAFAKLEDAKNIINAYKISKITKDSCCEFNTDIVIFDSRLFPRDNELVQIGTEYISYKSLKHLTLDEKGHTKKLRRNKIR